MAPAVGYIWGGTLRDSGRDTLAPAVGYMSEMICRLHLSFLCVVSICQGEEEGRKEEEGPDLSLKSNNPTLKGGEKCNLLDLIRLSPPT